MACLAASLVNPYTYRLHLHVVEFLRDPYYSQHIMEYMSLSFQHPLAMFLEAMLLGGALASAWYVRQGRYTEPLLYLVWAHEALMASRNIPICHDPDRPHGGGSGPRRLPASSGIECGGLVARAWHAIEPGGGPACAKPTRCRDGMPPA